MEPTAKLLTALAAILGAIAWPLLLFSVFVLFRSEVGSILTRLPAFFDKIKKASLAGITLELDRVAAEAASTENEGGTITPRQIQAAARIELQTREVGPTALLNELDQLCIEYDSLRRSLPPGTDRTRAMTRVLVRMRSLAPSLIEFIDVYKSSGSPGSRLAAIAMMQMRPHTADLQWLGDRFSSEQPFVFYHAAIALQNVANIADAVGKTRLVETIEQALRAVKSFTGVPDQGTIRVLEELLSSLSRNKQG